MTAYHNAKPIDPAHLHTGMEGTVYLFASEAELPEAVERLGLNPASVADCREYSSTRYDYGEGFDYILLNVPDFNDLQGEPGHVEIYLEKNLILLCHRGVAEADSLAAELRSHPAAEPVGVLYRFFAKLVENDNERLDKMEEEISDLEDKMVAQQPLDCTAEISGFRRDLLVLKRYYEAFFEMLEDMEENQNGLYTRAQLRTIRMCTNRVDRLVQTVLHLRDYVTQVRESYQAQLDIGLNQTMKILTVVTTIVSPLTLLVGWYGMNLLMPEYQMDHAYPVVIVLSIALVGASIVYFKRKNWF